MGGDLCLTLKTMFWCSFHPVSQVWLWNGREGGREGGRHFSDRTGLDDGTGWDGGGGGGGGWQAEKMGAGIRVFSALGGWSLISP